jgi:AcrR family transcriptional regulator
MATLSRRTTRSDEQRQRGEAALLAAAEELVAAGTAFGELSVDAIAKRAGFSRATFYAYFADKRALALALGERFGADLEEQTRPFLTGEDVRVRDTLAVVLATFSAHIGTVRALVEAATYDDDVGAFWRGLHDRFRVQLRERLLDAGIAKEAVDAHAFVLVWSTERCVTEHLAAPAGDDDAFLDALAAIWPTAA